MIFDQNIWTKHLVTLITNIVVEDRNKPFKILHSASFEFTSARVCTTKDFLFIDRSVEGRIISMFWKFHSIVFNVWFNVVFNLWLNVVFNVWINVVFNLGLNVVFNLGLNVVFDLGLNVVFYLGLNVVFKSWFNVVFKLWFNVVHK